MYPAIDGTLCKPQPPDDHSASAQYAQRFAGRIGRYLLDVQRDAVMEMLKPWPGATVLDVGGGHGQLAKPLSEAGYRVTVVSSTQAASDYARRVAGERIDHILGNLTGLPVAARSYDVAISFRIMPHLDDWRLLLSELCRVARCAVVVDYPIPRGVQLLNTMAFKLKNKMETGTRPYHVMSRSQVRQVFNASGFHTDADCGQFVLPMALHRVVKMPRVSRCGEALLHSVGLGNWVGNPVITRATPNDLPNRTGT
jgi:2-polyprenyl-3-methyl-5-hydroxy-6-metoxy-1,4-benzoquinol methylase